MNLGSSEFDPTLEDADLVELGLSKQIIKEEIYVPCHKSRGWIRCFVVLDDDNGFRLFLEGSKRFLLSAKLFDADAFLISMHADFPLAESKPKRGYIARLVKQKDASFHISLTGCRLCDNKLGYFTCGRGLQQREVIAKVSHSVKRLRAASTDLRCIVVNIPSVSSSDTRAIWCPRCLRIENPNLPMSADVSEALALTPGLGDRYVNKFAEWSTELGCLVLKFEGNRVLCASSRNFLLHKESKPGDSSESTKSTAILQFGRSSPTKYVLDFKYPLSPLQAFGIALSTFAVDLKPAATAGFDADYSRSGVTSTSGSMETAASASKGYFFARKGLSTIDASTPDDLISPTSSGDLR